MPNPGITPAILTLLPHNIETMLRLDGFYRRKDPEMLMALSPEENCINKYRLCCPNYFYPLGIMEAVKDGENDR